MNLTEKTLAELAQGTTRIATFKVGEVWRKGVVFENFGDSTDRYFAYNGKDFFFIHSFRLLNNGVKVGNEIFAIPAAELKALLSEAENG